MFIGINHDRIPLALRDYDRNKFVIEASLIVRRFPTLLTPVRKRILVFTTDLVLTSHILRRLAHREWMVDRGQLGIDEPPSDRGVIHLLATVKPALGFAQHIRRTAHRLYATSNKYIAVVRFDHACRDVDRFKTRRAQTVDRRSGHGLREPSKQSGHPSNIPIVLARLVRGSKVHIVNQTTINPGSLNDRSDHMSGKIIRTHRSQRATVSTDGGSQSTNDGGSSLHHEL